MIRPRKHLEGRTGKFPDASNGGWGSEAQADGPVGMGTLTCQHSGTHRPELERLGDVLHPWLFTCPEQKTHGARLKRATCSGPGGVDQSKQETHTAGGRG